MHINGGPFDLQLEGEEATVEDDTRYGPDIRWIQVGAVLS